MPLVIITYNIPPTGAIITCQKYTLLYILIDYRLKSEYLQSVYQAVTIVLVTYKSVSGALKRSVFLLYLYSITQI